MKHYRQVVAIVLLLVLCASTVHAVEEDVFSSLLPQLIPKAGQEASFPMQLISLLTLLTFAPAMLLMMTGFTRIAISLSFIKNAMGLQQSPPMIIIIGLSLFLTFFVMTPVFQEIYDQSYQPYVEGKINQTEALKNAEHPIKNFMFRQTRTKDLNLFLSIKGIEKIETYDEIPMHVLVPAFVISELKTAFQIGFLIYIPFLVIDMVVSSTLMAMGMMMLPPVIISLPFKILLFVLVDGWNLIIGSLVQGFR